MKEEGRRGPLRSPVSIIHWNIPTVWKKKKTVYLLYGTAPFINFLMFYEILDREKVSHSQILKSLLSQTGLATESVHWEGRSVQTIL